MAHQQDAFTLPAPQELDPAKEVGRSLGDVFDRSSAGLAAAIANRQVQQIMSARIANNRLDSGIGQLPSDIQKQG
jgi:hypothetical protein